LALRVSIRLEYAFIAPFLTMPWLFQACSLLLFGMDAGHLPFDQVPVDQPVEPPSSSNISWYLTRVSLKLAWARFFQGMMACCSDLNKGLFYKLKDSGLCKGLHK
jgi:hypothetical protein